MRRPPSSGFALVLVIIALFFTSVLLLVAAKNARTMQFQADRVQVRAVMDNLHSSALAWINHRVHDANLAPTPGMDPISLNADQLSDRPAELRVAAVSQQETQLTVTVQAAYTLGRQRRKREQAHTINLGLIQK